MGINRSHFDSAKHILALTAVVAGLSVTLPAHAGNVRSQILSYFDVADSMQQHVDDADIDRSDLSAVEKHYNDVRNTYVATPLREGLDQLKDHVDTFKSAFEKRITEFSNGPLQSATVNDKEIKKPNIVSNFNQCLRTTEGFNDFGNLSGQIQRFSDQLSQAFGSRFKRNDKGNNGWNARSDALRSQFSRTLRSLDLTEKSWIDATNDCCTTSLAPSLNDGNSLCANLKKTLLNDESVARNDGNSLYFSMPAAVDPPDPIKDGITGHMLADFARDRDYNKDITGARALAKDDLESAAAEEERAYSNAEYECSKNLKKAQKNAGPLNKQVVTTLGKLLKCTIIPTIGVTTMDLQYQRMTTAIGAVPIQGDDWDVNCDPNEMAAYNAMRPSDVNVVAQQWGIPGLQNPLYIDTLRRLEPVRSPFPIIAMPGGQLLTPFGDIDSTDTSTNGAASRSGTLVSSSGSSTGSTSRSNRGLVATAKTTARSSASRVAPRALASRATPRRTLAATQTMTQGIRTLSSRISSNTQAAEAINTLSSGTAVTRTLAGNMATNTRAIGTAAQQRSVRTQSASSARTVVRGITATRASRVTATGIASALGTRSSTSTSAGKTLSDVQGANDADRARINKICQTALSTIQSYKDKSQAVVTQIQELIAKRDQLVGGVLPKLITKAPNKQASIMGDLRNQLMSIDGQLGTLKTEYDVYASGVQDQGALVERLQGFSPNMFGTPSTGLVANANGPAAANLNGYTNMNVPGMTAPGGMLPIPGMATAAAQQIPGVMPVSQAFPTAPSPTGMNPKTGVSRAVEWVSNMLIPMPFAVASSQKLGRYNSEQEWRAAYDYFVKDFARYIKLRKTEEVAFAVQAKNALEKQNRLVTSQTATDLSTETLNLMQTYAGTVMTESDSIIRQAQAGALRLNPQQLSSVRKMRSNAQDSQDSIDAIMLMYKDSYPHSVDENAETWWGMVPDMLIN